MVDKIESKLNKLEKYIPFIDYLLQIDKEKYKKFVDIRFWITTKKRYPIDVLEKVEQSLVTQYKNLFLEDLDIPKSILKIFNTQGEVKCYTVNLCSDDEDDGKQSDESDDLEIVEVSLPPKHSSKAPEEDIKVRACEEKATSNLVSLVNNNASVHNYNSNMLEHTPQLSVSKNNSNEEIKCLDTDLNKKSSTCVDKPEISTVTHLPEEETATTSSLNQQTNEEHNYNKTVLNEHKLFKRRQDFVNTSDTKMNSLEKMDIGELTEVFNDLVEKTGIDLDKFVRTLSLENGENDNLQNTQVNYSQTFTRIEIDHCVPRSLPHAKLNENAQYFFEPYNQYGFVNNNTQSMAPPQFYGLNLKDPRVIKHLERLQTMLRDQSHLNGTAALNSNIPQVILNNVNQNLKIPRAVKQINPKKYCPTTYIEHKRLKAQRELDAKNATNSQFKDRTTTQAENARCPQIDDQLIRTKDIISTQDKGQTKQGENDNCSQAENRITIIENVTKVQIPSLEVKRASEVPVTNQINAAESASKSQVKDQKAAKSSQIKADTPKPALVQQQCDIKSILMSALKPYGDVIVDALRKDQNTNHKNQNTIPIKQASKQNLEISLKSSESKDEQMSVKSLEINKISKVDRKRTQSDTIESPSEPKRIRTISSTSSSSSSLPSTSVSSSPIQDTSIEDTPEIKQLKRLAVESKPIVLLKRLTQSDIEKHIKPFVKSPLEESLQILNVKLVEDVNKTNRKIHSAAEERTRRRSTLKYKNTDCQMTETNTKLCMLCKAKPSDLTNHYKRTHRTESYVARLSRSSLRSLEINIPFAQKLTNGTSINAKYKAKCVFCGDILESKFINFYKHYSIHTGEYAFQCSCCKLEKPFDVDIQSHQCHSKNCRNGKLRFLYQYPPNVMVIYLHCCKICNFVQLNEANTFKHLRDHHDKRQEDSTLVRKYILTAINDGETTEYTASGEKSKKLDIIDDNIAVCNEPILEDTTEPFKNNKALMTAAEVNQSNVDKVSVPSLEIETSNSSDRQETTDVSSIKSYTEQNFALFEHCDFIESIKSEQSNLYIPMESCETMITENNAILSNDIVIHKPKVSTPRSFYREYPKGVHYFGLLKCMAADCLFSTDYVDEMAQHLTDHENSECPPSGYLQCAYCQLDADECNTPEMLIQHVLNMHQRSSFQCTVCCYRANSCHHVLRHSEHAHGNLEDNVVFQCSDCNLSQEKNELDTSELLLENVRELSCTSKGCIEKYYSLNWLQEHIINIHGFMMDMMQFLEYTCIYCPKDFNDKNSIINHLVLMHPDELPYMCQRVLKTHNEGDSVHNLLLHLAFTDETNEKVIVTNVKTVMDIASQTEQNISEDSHELKPNLEQLIQVNQDVVKQLLLKLTSNTGISPDRLYQCPNAVCGGFFSTFELWHRHMQLRHQCIISVCPHCTDANNKDLLLMEFKEHFQAHCRHLYGCFHCGETFPNEDATRNHITLLHLDIENLRIEKIALYFNYSFNVLIKNDYQVETLNFLLELQENLRKRYQDMEKMNNDAKKTQWIVPLTMSWLEKFPSFTSNQQRKCKCFCANCTFLTYDNEILFEHLRSTHQIGTSTFKCSKCEYRIQSFNWDAIIDHIRMHMKNIHICCVCSYYHYDRHKLSAHINQEHRHRDVPVVNLLRTTECIQTSIEVAFAEGRKTFSTIKNCFFCSNMNWDKYAIHLKRDHNVTLNYFCEICDKQIIKLVDSESHFREEHKSEPLKIRCQLTTNLQLSIVSVTPLNIHYEFNGNREFKPAIKQECDSDDDVVVIDDDDIVIAEDHKACGSEQASLRVKCVNLVKLQSQLPEAMEINANNAATTQLFSPRLALRSTNPNFLENGNFTPATIRFIQNNFTELPIQTLKKLR